MAGSISLCFHYYSESSSSHVVLNIGNRVFTGTISNRFLKSQCMHSVSVIIIRYIVIVLMAPNLNSFKRQLKTFFISKSVRHLTINSIKSENNWCLLFNLYNLS